MFNAGAGSGPGGSSGINFTTPSSQYGGGTTGPNISYERGRNQQN